MAENNLNVDLVAFMRQKQMNVETISRDIKTSNEALRHKIRYCKEELKD